MRFLNSLPKLEDRLEKMQIKHDILKYEIEEREELLYRYNEKIAKIMLEELSKACKEVQVEFSRAHDENQKLQKLVHEL